MDGVAGDSRRHSWSYEMNLRFDTRLERKQRVTLTDDDDEFSVVSASICSGDRIQFLVSIDRRQTSVQYETRT